MGCFHDFMDALLLGRVLGKPQAGDLGVTHDDSKNVVEVVGDASSESSDGLQFLRLAKLGFEFVPFLFGPFAPGNIADNTQEDWFSPGFNAA